MHPERAQAGAFLPKLLEQAGLLKEAKTTKGAGENAQETANTVEKATEESLANRSSLGRSDDQVVSFVLLWDWVVRAELCRGVESCAESLKTGLVGGKLPGGRKWQGGVLAADGNIYGIPYHATQVLSVAAVKAAAPVAAVKEHVPGEKVLDANETSFAYIKPSP